MDSKSLFTSKTFWGVVLAVGSPMLARYGIPVDPGTDAATLVTAAGNIASGVGALLAIYGRKKAAQPVHVIPPKQ